MFIFFAYLIVICPLSIWDFFFPFCSMVIFSLYVSCYPLSFSFPTLSLSFWYSILIILRFLHRRRRRRRRRRRGCRFPHPHPWLP